MDRLPLEATGFLILFARLGAVLMLLPVFGEDAVPVRIRLLIALGMTLGLWALMSARVMPLAHDPAALPFILISELIVGIGLGMIVKIMFQAAAIAGSIASLQVGLTSAVVSDASQGGTAPLLSKFVSVAAAVTCMALSIHHLWIEAIVRSYTIFPIGGLPSAGAFAQLALKVTTRSLSLGLGLAGPLIIYGIVFNFALGLSARLAPAIQIFFISQPANLLLGLTLFAATLGGMLTSFAWAMSAWMQSGWS